MARARPVTSPRLFVALVAVLLLGWALRLHALDARSLWADEGWTLVLTEGPGLDDVTRTMAADQHPPLFFVAFRVWRTLTGESELALRYFSVLISVVGVAAIYPLGRGLFSPLTGLLAALLLALADLPIDLAQEVRHYGLMATLAIVSSVYYVRVWRRPTRARRIGYVLASLALLYTHYLGAFVLLAQGMHFLLFARGRRRVVDGLFLFGAVGLGFLPWLPVILDQNRVRWDDPLYFRNSVPNSIETYRAVRTALLGSHYGLLLALLLLGLVYVVYRQRDGLDAARIRLRPLWATAYPALWIVLMVGLTVAINARRQFLTERNFVLIAPAIAVLIAHGLTNLQRVGRVLLISVIVVVSLTTVDARRNYPDWRAVTANVTRYHRATEPVLMDVWVGDFPVRYYVAQQMGDTTPAISLREWRAQHGAEFLPRMLEYLRSIDAFWLVYWGEAPMVEYGGLIADEGFEQTAALVEDHMGEPLYSYRYDRAQPDEVARFGELFALNAAAAPERAAPGETLDVFLWWRASEPVPLDYSVSVVGLDAQGNIVAQHDSSPLEGLSPTSDWPPGALRLDVHRVALPPSLAAGKYDLGVRVYWYGDQQPLEVLQDGQLPGDRAIIGTVAVGADRD